MSAFTKPIVVSPAGNASVLERIPLASGNSESFSEKWLQDTLFAYPNCLPVVEVDPHIGKLIPICTELETGAGPADILFVTATGKLVLVETKLWRNPEARREVVAQILDYAKQLAGWSYEDLAREAARATRRGPEHLISCLNQADPTADEASFVDGINRSLKAGDFLLLIVGDGIRSGAEALVGFIERYGNLRFSLGLVEVAAYRMTDGGTLLQPRVLAKTEVIKRTVLIGPSGPLEFEQIAVAEEAVPRSGAQAQWFRAFWSEYLTTLKLDDLTQPKPQAATKSSNQYLPMPPGGSYAWLSAYLAQSTGRAGVFLTFSKAFEKAPEYYERLLAEREDIELEVGAPLSWECEDGKAYISCPAIQIADLDVASHRGQVIAQLADWTNRFVNAFRHRLETMSKEVV